MYPDVAAIALWFGRRQGSVSSLSVTGKVPRLPASLLATVLMTQMASLRALELAVGAVRLSAADFAVLAMLTELETLTIELPELDTVCWDDHRAVLMQTLSRLPALKSIYCHSYVCTLEATKPAFKHLAVLESSTVVDMRLVCWPATRGGFLSWASCQRWYTATSDG